eukprot:3894240-Prymnesium_polylepis.2
MRDGGLDRRTSIPNRVGVCVATELFEHLLRVAVGGMVDEGASTVQLLANLLVNDLARRLDAFATRGLREPLDQRRLLLVVGQVQEGLEVGLGHGCVEQSPHAPLAPSKHGQVQRRVTVGVLRLGVCAVEQQGVQDFRVAATRRPVLQRARIGALQKLCERPCAIAFRRSQVLSAKVERVDDAGEVALSHRRDELAHHLKVAVARRLLSARHRLGAQLQLAHVALEADNHLDVAVAPGQRLLVPVVELLHVCSERVEHLLEAGVHPGDV